MVAEWTQGAQLMANCGPARKGSNSEVVPTLGAATSPKGGSSRIHWEYMSHGFQAGHGMGPFGHFEAQEIY